MTTMNLLSQSRDGPLLSDRATFAWLCDVFVEWAEKNEIKRIILATRDAHEVYSQVGFQPLHSPDRWMEIDERPQTDRVQ